MALKMMPEEELRKLIEGHEDVLTPAMAEQNNRIQSKRCGSCGGKMVKYLDPTQPFLAGAFLANYQAKCIGCGRVDGI